MTNEYVCGFLFTDDLSQVILIRKNKPEWQYGKFNGVGGKIEVIGTASTSDERPLLEKPEDAMRREFLEETGATTHVNWWKLFRTERFQNGAVVHFLYAVSSSAFAEAETKTDERIVKMWVPVALKSWREAMMYNLPYLIEMALALNKLDEKHWPAP